MISEDEALVPKMTFSRQLTPRTPKMIPGLSESRPYSRTTLGGQTVRTMGFSLDPFDRFKVDDLTNFAMNDQRWTLQRKKIGLKRRTSGTRERKHLNKQSAEMILKFIRSNFSRKECMTFSKDYHRSNLMEKVVCRCGQTREEHYMNQHKSEHGLLDKNGDSSTVITGFHPYDKTERSFIKQISSFNPFAKRSRAGIENNLPPLDGVAEEVSQSYRRPTVVEEEDEEDVEDDGKMNDVLGANYFEVIETAERMSTEINKKKDTSAAADKETKINNAPAEKRKKWRIDSAMRKFPTNAYGNIEFVNESFGTVKPAKYIRLTDDTTMEQTMTLMTDYWRLFEPIRPHLVISVMGGAKNFRLDGKKKETFTTGLIKAVQSTNAWVLTGGTNVGIMKTVGEAVKEGQSMVKIKRKSFFEEERDHMVRAIKLIGFSPFGYVKNNHLLVNKNPNEFQQVKYKMEDKSEHHKNVSLNGDHTHFFLVDNGIRNRYSGSDKFRSRVERAIQDPEPAGLGIPVVLLLLDGGISSAVECKLSLQSDTPLVVVSNTGRCADLMAYAVSMTIQTASGKYILRKGHQNQLKARIASTMHELDNSTREFCYKTIVECCEMRNLITIFDINSSESMDKYILHALLKDENDATESNKIDQLNLSLLWNRPDIAESHIFPSVRNWPSDSLEDLMTIALMEEKVDFVRLLAANGLIMSDYLNVQRLRKLYNEGCTADMHGGRLLQRCANSSYFYLNHVHRLLQALVRKHHDLIYIADTETGFRNDPAVNYKTFRDPYQELVMWAIFSGRAQLATYLWERTNSPLSIAIVASSIYKSMWESLGVKNTELRREYMKNKDIFEQIAVGYLEVSYKKDTMNSIGILERRHAKWGELDCLELAQTAEDMKFISSPGCQASVELNWRRGMIRASPFSVIIANFMPFLIWTRLFRFQKLGDSRGELTALQKLLVFYKSPISKFYAHSTSFLVFLVLYAYVVLFDFKFHISLTEQLVIVWICTHVLEEINELLLEDATEFRIKLSDWWSSVWNRFDCTAFLLFFIALSLRLNSGTFTFGRIAYAVNTTVFYLRLFRIYHVNYHLGPKLVIFYRMFSEVLVFMALLIIFILGYGIASQALLNPWRTLATTNMSTIMKKVILIPYYQMYGELQLDQIVGEDSEVCYVTEEDGVSICENASDYTWVAHMMLVFYLIIGNIMLLNLLIAIFTYVFDEVQENSMEIWKYEMYRLMREYDNKPGLVSPFVVFELVYRLGKIIWKKFFRKKRENLDDYMKETLHGLAIFEKEVMNNYLMELSNLQQASIDNIVGKMAEKIDRVLRYVEQEQELREIEEDIEIAIETEEESIELREKLKREKEKSSDEEDEEDTDENAEEAEDKLGEEISDDDMENKLDILNLQHHGIIKKYHTKSIPPSRAHSAMSTFSRPASGRSIRLARSTNQLKQQFDSIRTIEERVDNLQQQITVSNKNTENTLNLLLDKIDILTNTTNDNRLPKASKTEDTGNDRLPPSPRESTTPLPQRYTKSGKIIRSGQWKKLGNFQKIQRTKSSMSERVGAKSRIDVDDEDDEILSEIEDLFNDD